MKDFGSWYNTTTRELNKEHSIDLEKKEEPLKSGRALEDLCNPYEWPYIDVEQAPKVPDSGVKNVLEYSPRCYSCPTGRLQFSRYCNLARRNLYKCESCDGINVGGTKDNV